MTIEAYQLHINDLVIDVVRKDIKNLHLGVYPPDGRVRVAVPLQVNDDAVRMFAISKLAWIRQKQLKFAHQERQTIREYVTGESHYYRGTRYLLDVQYHDGTPAVVIRNYKRLDLIVRTDSNMEMREGVMTAWYRQQLKEAMPPLIAKWEKIIGEHAAEWRIKEMKTRWGTCNIKARRIWLNLELIKKPPSCLEYVIVHELVHLLERHHNERFYTLMTRYMPQWHFQRDLLNQSPLTFAFWDY